MVFKCCVPGCRSGYAEKKHEKEKPPDEKKPAPKVSFHAIPTDPKVRPKWLAAIPRSS